MQAEVGWKMTALRSGGMVANGVLECSGSGPSVSPLDCLSLRAPRRAPSAIAR